MASLLLRRLSTSAVLVIAASSMVYLLAATQLDPRSNFQLRQPRPSEAVVQAQLAELNLDDRTPVLRRYATWVGGLARGDFGRSVNGGPINPELARRAGVSLRLLLAGSLLGGLLGVAFGAFAAMRQYRIGDRAVTAGAFLVLSVPVFVFAVLLEMLAVRINGWAGTQVFLYTGEVSPEVTGTPAVLLDRLQHLAVPTVTIAAGQLAIIALYQRNAMLDVLGSDYVRTARAKGLRRRSALLRHGLRTALSPSVTYFAYGFGLLLTGAVFTETIFAWHGMGEWLVEAIRRNDVNVVAAVSVFAATVVLLAGLFSDVVHAALDPRMRAGAGP